MKLLLTFLLLSSVFTGCSTVSPYNTARYSESLEKEASRTDITETQRLLIQAAGTLLGVDSIRIKGRTFNFDCTGVVLACYYYAGIDLTDAFPHYTGNGVSRIYQYLEDNDLLYRTETPEPGDIIFWDNTYDRNGDGVENDLLTHMGMVVASEDGNIVYIHVNYRKGVILEKMNLKRKNEFMDGNAVINSPMRMKGSKKSPRWLSSHLFRIFGKGYALDGD